MQYGAHLPLIRFDGTRQTLDDLRAYARRAAALEFRYLCANDHLLFGRPWLDGPTGAVLREGLGLLGGGGPDAGATPGRGTE